MASFANQLSIVVLLSLLSSLQTTHARDSQFFNKVPSTNNVDPKNQQPQNQDPNFQPEIENNYGLYRQNSGELTPSTTTATLPPSKYLPKNYNPVAYVTVPEDTTDNNNDNDNKFYRNNNSYDNGAQNFYDNQQEEGQTPYRSYTATTNTVDDNSFYDGAGSRFSSQPLGGGAEFQPQGMSDTRALENGKYHYDIHAGRYSGNHPYESLRGVRRSYGGAGVYGEFSGGNAIGGYHENQNEFQQEVNFNEP